MSHRSTRSSSLLCKTDATCAHRRPRCHSVVRRCCSTANNGIIPLIPHMRLTCESHSSPVPTASGGPNPAVHGETGEHDTLAAGVGVVGARGASLAAKIRRLPQMTAKRSVSYMRKQHGRPFAPDGPPAGPPGEVHGRLILCAIPRSSAVTFDGGQWNAMEKLLFFCEGKAYTLTNDTALCFSPSADER